MGYWHSLYDTRTFNKMKELNCEYWGLEFDKLPSDECMDLLEKFVNDTQDVNVYNIHGFCYGLNDKFSAKRGEKGMSLVGG